MLKATRRQAILGTLLGTALISSTRDSTAQEAAPADPWRTSDKMGEPSRYGDSFKHYDHVNPGAPKGGTLNSFSFGTFDSFNPFIAIGSPAAGLNYQGGILWDSLLTKSVDEATTSHAQIAEAFKYPADFSSATYRLNPKARWHDGTPITVEDVIWSMETMKRISPNFISYFRNVKEVVKVGDREVEFRFDQTGNRELPLIMGDLVVLPKLWWEGTNAKGEKRNIDRPTLEPPLGSGAYKIESFDAGNQVIWARVTDYWGADLPTNVGRNNFDRMRYRYVQSEAAEWQGFSKGGLEDMRPENQPPRWVKEYNFPAVKAGDVIKREFPDRSGEPMQGYAMNMRRPQFQDRKVRQALTLMYNFETFNATRTFNLNKRTNSYWVGQELASSGLPQGRELEILGPYRDQLPPELFTQEFKLPVYTRETERTHLRDAVRLMAEAGWTIKGGKMVNAQGQQFRCELLIANDYQEFIGMPLIQTMRQLGIDAPIRLVDTTQYIARQQKFDYDMILAVIPQSQSPGNEQRNMWSSGSVNQQGSENYMGIKNPVIDKLVERVIYATDRDDQVIATHALDRALLWGYYIVPQYHRPFNWLAYWNKFGIPEKQPSDVVAYDMFSFWIDPEKEKALAAKYGFAN